MPWDNRDSFGLVGVFKALIGLQLPVIERFSHRLCVQQFLD